MSAQHARPLVAYVCLALIAALVLLQGAGVRSAGPAMLGRAAQAVQVAASPVLSHDRSAGEVAAMGTASGPAPAVSLVSAAPVPTAVAPAGQQTSAPAASSPRRPLGSSSRGAKATRPAAQASGPGKGKGNARGAVRHDAGDSRVVHRGSLRLAGGPAKATAASGKAAAAKAQKAQQKAKSKAKKAKKAKAQRLLRRA